MAPKKLEVRLLSFFANLSGKKIYRLLMRSLLAIILIFAANSIHAQRQYAYCNHAYCHALHIYGPPGYHQGTLPGVVGGAIHLMNEVILDNTGANPYHRHQCQSSSKLANKYYKIGNDSLISKKGPRNEELRMALIYFKGAITEDSTYCDAYDQVVNCFYLTHRYDSALKAIDRQRNPSFHSVFAKGVILFEKINDFEGAERYFDSLCRKSPTAIFFYYRAMCELKLNKLDAAKASVAEMEKTLKAWDDGPPMEKQNMFLRGVIACKEKDYDTAFTLLARLEEEFEHIPAFCHYYAESCLYKTKPKEKHGKKFNELAEARGYNPEKMI